MKIKDFVLNVGPQGTFKPSGKYHSIPQDIDSIFEKFETEEMRNISLFFHGGLVNEKTGIETAIKMEKILSSEDQKAICVVWETGLFETISSNLSKVSETRLYNKLIKYLTKKLASKLGFGIIEGRSAGNELSIEQIEEELVKKNPFENYTQGNLEANGRGADASMNLPSRSEDLEIEFQYMIAQDDELVSILDESEVMVSTDSAVQSRGLISTALLVKSLAKIAFKVIKRFVRKIDHSFYPTIIEELLRELYVAELGAFVWNSMKKKSTEMWNDNDGVSGINQFAGRYLLDKLITYHKKYPETKINLIGHSAGSIAICNLLNISRKIYPELVFNNIIFMAPACRVDLFRNEVVTHQGQFETFRIFTMTDDNEKKDILVPYFYTHSLLYLISGVLENKGKDYDAYILGMERHIDGRSPYNGINEILETRRFLYEEGKNRVVFSETDTSAIDGLQTNSLTHGGFDDDPNTIKSIKFILS